MKRWAWITLAALLLLPALGVAGESSWTAKDGRRVIVIDEDGDGLTSTEDGKGGYLGVTLEDLDGDAEGKGVRIRSVFDDTPAAEAGLEAGDIVFEFDGDAIADAAALTAKVRAHAPGEAVSLKARRDGESKTFKVALGERERSLSLSAKGDWQSSPDAGGFHWMRDFGDLGRGRLGVEVRDLAGSLAAYFPNVDAGALVLSVEEDSPAAKAGLEAGDVIVGLGEEKVADAADLREAVGTLAGEAPGELRFVRKGERRTASVEIPASDHTFIFQGMADDDEHPRILRRLKDDGGDLERKLERLEQRLEELEKRLEKGGERRG